MVFKKILSYITFKKQEDTQNSNIRLMHGINRISILMFLCGVIYMVVRFLK
jgi:hypothetical protein